MRLEEGKVFSFANGFQEGEAGSDAAGVGVLPNTLFVIFSRVLTLLVAGTFACTPCWVAGACIYHRHSILRKQNNLQCQLAVKRGVFTGVLTRQHRHNGLGKTKYLSPRVVKVLRPSCHGFDLVRSW